MIVPLNFAPHSVSKQQRPAIALNILGLQSEHRIYQMPW